MILRLSATALREAAIAQNAFVVNEDHQIRLVKQIRDGSTLIEVDGDGDCPHQTTRAEAMNLPDSRLAPDGLTTLV